MKLFYSIFLFFFIQENLVETFFFKNRPFKKINTALYEKKIDDIYLDYLKKYKKEDNIEKKFMGFFGNQISINEDNFEIFKKNYQKINEINDELSNNKNSFQLGFNEDFDNIPYDENSNFLMNKIIPSNYTLENKYEKYLKQPFIYIKNFFSLKKEFNWNHTEYLSEVKNQGSCGSCWAFATTNALESFMRSQNYNVTRLSEQELVDCSRQNYGCNGGFMHKAFDFIIENKGLVSNEDYPYQALTNKCLVCNCKNNTHIIDDYNKNIHCCNDEICDCDRCVQEFNVSEIIHLNKVNGSQLQQYEFTIPKSIIDRIISLQISPITIAVDASSIYFRYYKEGVIDIKTNTTQQLNHAVLLVGYGFDEKGLYWIIQNSWGKNWGDNGFCKIRVEDGDGILLSNIYGVYPSKI